MCSALHYWRFFKIDAASQYYVEELPHVKAFYHHCFGGLSHPLDLAIQAELMAIRHDPSQTSERHLLAELCLRCYISHSIQKTCMALGNQFGGEHGFSGNELLRFVMDDTNPTQLLLDLPSTTDKLPSGSQATSYECLAAQILRTFNPERSSLSTWTATLTRQHPELKAFLLEHGVYLLSDWAILNDTTPEELRRILAQVCGLSANLVQRYAVLLDCYHEVYRSQYRRSRGKGRCKPPDHNQLEEIRSKARLSPEVRNPMQELLAIAAYLRQYRISRKGGRLPVQSIDRHEMEPTAEVDRQEEEHTSFLDAYRQRLVMCLDRAIHAEIQQWQTRLQQRTPQKASVLVQVLDLYYCKSKSMAQIAVDVGLKAQYEVSRLLKIDEFRSRIRCHTLKELRHCVLDLAHHYTHPERLQDLDERVDAALNDYLDSLILEPTIRANAAETCDNHCDNHKVFVHRLCRIVHKLQTDLVSPRAMSIRS